jgi:hypothetical protein
LQYICHQNVLTIQTCGVFFHFLNLEIMNKSLNFNYIYIAALFLTVGCAKESLSPDQTDAILAMAHTDNPEGPDPDPHVDCKCYMSITGVDWEGEFPFLGFGLLDVTPSAVPNSQKFEVSIWQQPVSGVLGWQTGGSMGAQYPLPSPFFELNPPSNGWHSFNLLHQGQQITIYTIVRCYLQEADGSQTLATTTYHSFSTPETPDQFYDILPPRQFSCLVLTDGGQVPKDDGN